MCSHMNASTAPVNIVLRNLVQKLHPEAYAERERELAAATEFAASLPKVPLFCMAEPLMPNQVRV